MKFSSSLKFNAVPEWWDEYIAYDALKKYIYQLEKRQAGLQSYHDADASEHSALIAHQEPEADYPASSTDPAFVRALDRERTKIAAFYAAQEEQLEREVNELEVLVTEEEQRGPEERWADIDDEDDEDEEEEDDLESHPRSRNGTRSPIARRRTLSPPHAGAHEAEASATHTLEDSMASLSPLSAAQLNGGGPLSPSISFGKAKSRSPVARRKRKRSLAGRLRDSITSATGYFDGAGSTTWTSNSHYAEDTRLLFKRKITLAYVSAASLKSYVELNFSGFKKILKKYDKVTDSRLKDHFVSSILSPTPPFSPAARAHLGDLASRLSALYTRCVTQGDTAAAERELKLHQREHIAWERDTVWRTMINQERRAGSTSVARRTGGGGGSDDSGADVGMPHVVVPEEKGVVDVQTPAGRLKITKKMLAVAAAVGVGVALLNISVIEAEEANRCLAILVFCTILWATEAIPLFVTSMFVPLLLVTLRVIRSPPTEDNEPRTRLTTPEATKYVFSTMFSPTIMLLIGGFTIASALSKTAIDRILITRVLSLAGTRPNTVLLAFMGVACFASMWISNVAAPTLCFTLIRPILRTLPPKSSFAPCLIIAIALAANIGGQSSPISSPQNLIAIGAMEPPLDWARWFAVAIPVSIISLLLIWLLLIVSYRPSRHPTEEGELEIRGVRPTRDRFTAQQWWVSAVCLVTIGLWCVEHAIEDWVGDMGVIALLPVIAFFATGVLKKDDFEQFAWTIVFLAMGGIALGKGVSSSGLLDTLDIMIRKLVGGLGTYSVVLVLSAVVLVISTFISHTIASVLLVPIAKEVGKSLPGNHSNLLIFITGLICSTGMGMPVSGFPNQTAATQEDDLGQLYLSNVDFLKNGVPASIIAALIVATVGFLLMKLIGL